MLAKTWKKIGLIILIIACLWNIVSKLVYKISFDDAIDTVKNTVKASRTENQEEVKT